MDFLTAQSLEALKRTILNILESYHNSWDILSELAQNSVDAIERKRGENSAHVGLVQISFDATSRQICFKDNGIGINEEKLLELLRPGGTDKDARDEELGEKGVGLKFCMFSANAFKIVTRGSDGKLHGGKINQANSWLQEKDITAVPPRFEPLKVTPSDYPSQLHIAKETFDMTSFCEVTIENVVVSEDDIFARSASQLRFILRSRTAIGRTFCLWNGNSPSITCFLEMTLAEGVFKNDSIPTDFFQMHKFHKKHDNFNNMISQFATFDEKKKFTWLKNKTIWHTENFQWGGRTIKVYGVMYPGHKMFREMVINYLALESEETYDEEQSLFAPRIYIASKGIPTGVVLRRPSKGARTQYYQRCFFLVEFNEMKFDQGRKSITWQAERQLQNSVAKVFARFEPFAKYQSNEKLDPDDTTDKSKAEIDAEKKGRWEHAKNLVELGYDQISFKKQPDRQEAAVAGIFHELLGAKILKNYRPLTTGYGSRYDMLCEYVRNTGKPLDLIIEYKYTLDALLDDLTESTKYLEDIHMLVAWTANEQKLLDNGLILQLVSEDEQTYEGQTHRLADREGVMQEIAVILLKNFIERKLQ